MIRYSRVNQWRIYNLKIRKIFVLASIRIDKDFGYYDTSYEFTNVDDNSDKLSNI